MEMEGTQGHCLKVVAEGPGDQLAARTYIWTAEGWCCVMVLLDLYSGTHQLAAHPLARL